MRLKLIFSSLAFALLLGFVYTSSPIQPRENYGARLEPAGRILHGAGQDPSGFLNYWNVMDEAEKPIAYMYYIGLRNVGTTWIDRLKSDLLQYKDRMTVLQIGLELTAGGDPYTEEVSRGVLDDDIDTILDGLQEIGLPVYLRIGYEFNGVSWNGYQPESYKAAFRYIAQKVRERDLEIATVWNFAPDGDSNFMVYFPGDEYVDWWAFNPFSTSHLTHPDVFDFLDSAHVHQRPVLIGESTPRYVGTTGGQSSWDQWFEPFFDLVHANPGIKMLSYINWNWAEFPQWSNWGDARLEMNQVVRDHYAAEMDSATYLHAVSEAEFRSLLGYNDAIAPGMVTGLAVADTSFPGMISWDPVSDESGIARYLLFNAGELYDYTGNSAYSFVRGQPGDTMMIAVVPVDRAGNAGQATNELVFVIPSRAENPADQIANGGFEQGSDPWELVTFVSDAAATFDIDTTNPIDGAGSGRVQISATSGTNWHIQLRHPIRVSTNKRYVITYSARASQNTAIETWLQQDHSPFEGYAFQSIALTTEAQAFRDTAFVREDDTVFLTFMVGNSGTRDVWFDNVSVIEEDWEPEPVEPKFLENGGFEAGLSPWILDLDGLARASAEIDDSGQIEGQNSARVTISRTTNTNWHVQLRQPIDVKAGAQYVVRYQARANQDTSIETWLQQDHSPYLGYLEKVVNLTTSTQAFVDTATVDVDDTVFLAFMMGNSGLSQIWIDDVSVTEIGVTAINDPTDALPSGFSLDPPYPNPFNPSTRISYEIPESGRVSLRIYDGVGREITRLVDGSQNAGRYVADWDAALAASGTYVVRLAVDGRHISSRTLVLVK